MMRQTDDRYLCSEIVKVFYEDDFQNTRQSVANLEEISSRSVTLLCDQELKAGRPVSICLKDHDLYGTVASATYERHLGWFAVVQLEPSSEWSPHWFLPEHSFRVGAVASADTGQLIATLVK
jgi:hypothetical protein